MEKDVALRGAERGAVDWTAGAAGLAAALLAGLGGLALARLGYEVAFPRLMVLGRPVGVVVVMLLAAGGGWLVWRRGRGAVGALLPFLPLLLNLLWLFDPAVNLVRGWVLVGGGVWLAMVFGVAGGGEQLTVNGKQLTVNGERGVRSRWRGAGGGVWVVVALLPVYLLTMGRTVGQADTFEFQVVIPQLGIAHPTGYPLYMLIGKLFTFIPAGTVAWRINLASVVLALGAVYVVYRLVWLLSGRVVPAVLAALLLGLMPTFWSQAIEAEVYALQGVIVGVALWVMVGLTINSKQLTVNGERGVVVLALLLGLGLANHLTTVFLFPPAGVACLFYFRRRGVRGRTLLWMALAFLLPLLLYAYLPLRWAAVNGEPMGTARFLDWVVGGRFQGALQWRAWLEDPARYGVVGRLFLAEWQPAGLLLLVAGGLLALFWRRRPAALILLLAWAGYTFYALNYYVPDLAVFLLPAFLITAVWWGVGLAAVLEGVARWSGRVGPLPGALLLLAAIAPVLLAVGNGRWAARDRSGRDGQTTWGRAVLEQPLPEGAAILADSDKFPPLYYLQQAEGLRPDLEIVVLPDEAAYRAELRARLAAGQAVYLARFLPGLEGSYHLRAAGPLTEVGTEPWREAPAGIMPAALSIGSIRLLGYTVAPVSAYDPGAAALTLYWQAAAEPEEALYVYTRWAGEEYEGTPIPAGGQHPANNDYPTAAWEAGEVVPDFHLLPRPVLNEAQELAVQVALAPPFTRPEALDWQTVTTLEVEPPQVVGDMEPLRAVAGPVALAGVQMAEQQRPGTDLEVLLAGYGVEARELVLALRPVEGLPQMDADGRGYLDVDGSVGFVAAERVRTDVPAGMYEVYARHPAGAARCGWLAPLTEGCVVGRVEISGVPLPEGAVNFGDRFALLDVEVPEMVLQPGGRLAVTLEWLALSAPDADFTVFVQVLDEQERIVGQVDSWPMQGTYPTSQWPAGEQVRDPYVVQLDADLRPGTYRLAVGWYLLATLERLPVLDEAGAIVDDRVIISGLRVE